MTELVSTVPAIEISTDTIVEVETTLPSSQVNTSESITVEIQPDTYVLSSSGMYTGNMTGKIPTWILDAIQEQLTTGDGNIASVLDDIQLLLDGLQLGVNQAISQIENTNTSMSALETSLNSKIGANNAAILDVYATKVTPTEAQAIAVQAIGSTFNGNVDAYIGNLASTYTNATSAVATDIHTLQVSYNDQTARIDTVEEVSLSKNTTIRSATAPTLITNPKLIIGDSWINTTNNVTKSWNGSSWVDITNTNAQQAYTWSATASKLITAPDGSVTGWSFGDGSNTKSSFKIKATNFSISDGTTGYTPFSITGTDINFLGKVSFNSLTNVPQLGSTPQEVVTAINTGNTTTIDGGKITTYSIGANQIIAYSVSADRLSSTSGNSTVWNGGGLVSSNFNGNVVGNIGIPTQGFRLSSNAAGTSADPNIYGGYIKGGAIEGAQLIGAMLSVNDIKVVAVGYPNNYGPIVLIEAYGGVTTNTSSIFYSRGYSIGYNNKRMCSGSQIFILQALTVGGFNIYGSVPTTVSIQVSINGGPWTVIASGRGEVGIASCAITYTVDSTNNVQFLSTHSSNFVQSSNFSIQSINGQ